MPDAFVVPFVLWPLRVNFTVLPEIGVPELVASDAVNWIAAPWTAEVGPVYVTTVPSLTARVDDPLEGAAVGLGTGFRGGDRPALPGGP